MSTADSTCRACAAEDTPGFSEVHDPRRALEEGDAELALELPDRLGQRWLRDVELFRRSTEVQFLVLHREEVTKLPQLDRRTPCVGRDPSILVPATRVGNRTTPSNYSSRPRWQRRKRNWIQEERRKTLGDYTCFRPARGSVWRYFLEGEPEPPMMSRTAAARRGTVAPNARRYSRRPSRSSARSVGPLSSARGARRPDRSPAVRWLMPLGVRLGGVSGALGRGVSAVADAGGIGDGMSTRSGRLGPSGC